MNYIVQFWYTIETKVSRSPQKEFVWYFMIKTLLIYFIFNHNVEFNDVHLFLLLHGSTPCVYIYKQYNSILVIFVLYIDGIILDFFCLTSLQPSVWFISVVHVAPVCLFALFMIPVLRFYHSIFIHCAIYEYILGLFQIWGYYNIFLKNFVHMSWLTCQELLKDIYFRSGDINISNFTI